MNRDPLPTVPLLVSATPLHRLHRLSDRLSIDLWIKRDDLTEIGGGGNKLRKLEYLLGAAIDQNSDVLLTAGSVQSNHCRLTASVAASYGIECRLVLTVPIENPSDAYMASGNRALFDLFGAHSVTLAPGQDSGPALERLAEGLIKQGRKPMVIPIGGSTPLGSLGYVDAAKEIADQLAARGDHTFDLTVCCSGSGGMQAGLEVGRSIHPFTKRILGVSVGRRRVDQIDIVSALADGTLSLLGGDTKPNCIEVSDAARGPGYGRPGEDALQAIRLAARLEGILLDPVYTGKAFAGLVAMISDGSISTGSRVLFWHSGGSPALFAYPESTSEGGHRAARS